MHTGTLALAVNMSLAMVTLAKVHFRSMVQPVRLSFSMLPTLAVGVKFTMTIGHLMAVIVV